MSEILKFIIDNFHKLKEVDYAILFVFILFAGVAIYIFFRWFYKARLQAQAGLVDIQDKAVQTLSSRLEFTKRERDDLQKQLERIQQQLKKHATDGKPNTSQTEALYERTLLIVSDMLILLLDRVALAYEGLFIYTLALSKYPPKDAFEVAQAFRDRVTLLQKEYDKARDNPTGRSMSKLVDHLQTSDIMQIANRVYTRYRTLGDEIVAHKEGFNKGS